jgi:hypothetical protein
MGLQATPLLSGERSGYCGGELWIWFRTTGVEATWRSLYDRKIARRPWIYSLRMYPLAGPAIHS